MDIVTILATIGAVVLVVAAFLVIFIIWNRLEALVNKKGWRRSYKEGWHAGIEDTMWVVRHHVSTYNTGAISDEQFIERLLNMRDEVVGRKH